jgi:hypothetical protein
LEKNRTTITGDLGQDAALAASTVTSSSSPSSSGITVSKQQQQKRAGGSSQKSARGQSADTEGAYNFNKNVKPPYSYAAMIAQAINSCPEKKMTLSSIYAYITTHFPYYQMTQNGWQVNQF